MKTKVGFVLGRFQGFHLGHEAMIEKSVDENDLTVVMIGSAQDNFNQNNPFSVRLRSEIINECIYKLMTLEEKPFIKTFFVDNAHLGDDKVWGDYVYDNLIGTLNIHDKNDDIEITYYTSDIDCAKRWFGENENISKIVELERSDIPYSGTMVREALLTKDAKKFEEITPSYVHMYYRKMMFEVAKYHEGDKHEVVYSTPFVDLMKRTSEDKGTYYYVRESWLPTGEAVAILPYREYWESGRGHVTEYLLIEEFGDKKVHQVIKGGCDKVGESHLSTAVRELHEEAGIVVDPDDVIYLGKVRNSKLCTTMMHLFAVDVTNYDLPNEDELKPIGDGTSNESGIRPFWINEETLIEHCEDTTALAILTKLSMK